MEESSANFPLANTTKNRYVRWWNNFDWRDFFFWFRPCPFEHRRSITQWLNDRRPNVRRNKIIKIAIIPFNELSRNYQLDFDIGHPPYLECNKKFLIVSSKSTELREKRKEKNISVFSMLLVSSCVYYSVRYLPHDIPLCHRGASFYGRRRLTEN